MRSRGHVSNDHYNTIFMKITFILLLRHALKSGRQTEILRSILVHSALFISARVLYFIAGPGILLPCFLERGKSIYNVFVSLYLTNLV